MPKHNNQGWRKVACPVCHRPAGANCVWPEGNSHMRHRDRQTLAERIFGVSVPIALTRRDPKVRAYQTRKWCTACRGGHPENCTGLRRVKRVGLVPCECPAHGKTAQ